VRNDLAVFPCNSSLFLSLFFVHPPPPEVLNMSGAFNYPREEHHVVLNVDDSVVVDWWSTFANTLVIQCYERGDIEAGDEESEIQDSLSYRRSSSNKQ